MTLAIAIENLSHEYGQRLALNQLSLSVRAGEIFAFLGPNGGGKTTLFRLLGTLLPVQRGEFSILGVSHRDPREIRRSLGVVFQSPSLDVKLTVAENILCHAALYGLKARREMEELTSALGIADRRHERVQTLSGGMRRRVELAQTMVHRPRLLLMDEPSTGLDPGARGDFWRLLRQLQVERGVTIALTTHLLEEAEKADRLAILHQGQLSALGSAAELKAEVGGQSLVIQGRDLERLAAEVQQRLEVSVQIVDQTLRIESPQAAELVPRLAAAWPDSIQSVTVGQPTLEDVFIRRTGRSFWSDN